MQIIIIDWLAIVGRATLQREDERERDALKCLCANDQSNWRAHISSSKWHFNFAGQVKHHFPSASAYVSPSNDQTNERKVKAQKLSAAKCQSWRQKGLMEILIKIAPI